MDSKEILYSILSDTEDLFYRTDGNGILIWVAPSAVKMLKCNSTEELLGRNFTDEFFADPEQRRFFRNELQEKCRIIDYQFVMRRPDGSTFTVTTDSQCYKDKDGNIAGVEGVCRDITERMNAEQALIQAERKYHALIDNTPCVMWCSDRLGNTTFISQNVTNIYGYTPEEIYESGKDLWFKRIHPEDIKTVKNNYDDLFTKGSQFDIEYRIQHRDGKWIWLRDRAVMTDDIDGIAYAYGVFSDITGRKQAEEKIKESEERYRLLINNFSDPIALYDLSGNILLMNDTGARNLGENPEGIIGRSIYDYFPDISDVIAERIGLIAESGKGVEYEDLLKLPSGEHRWFLSNHQPVKDIKGNIYAIQTITYDITARKRAEEEIARKNIELNSFIDSIPDLAWFKDIDSNFVIVNKAFADVVGMDPEYLVNNTCEICFGKKAAEKFKEDDQQVMKNRKRTVVEESIVDTKGNKIFLETIKSPLLDESGNVVGTIGVARNINQRKKAEDTLRESEEKYRRLVDALQEGIWAIDEKENTTFVNNRMAEMLGYTVDEMIGKTVFEFMDERGVELCKYYVEKRKEGVKEQHDFELIKKDGSRLYVTMEASPIYDESGNYLGGVTGIIDVTERRLAEEALVESEGKFRQIAETIEEVFWIVSPDWSKVHYISPAYEKVWGFSCQSLYDRPKLWIDSIHEEDRGLVLDYIEQKASGALSEIIFPEYRIVKSDGSTRWIFARGFPIKDEQGGIERVAGIAEDITERKNAEAVILNVAKGVSATTGEKFFESLAEYLAYMLEADYAYIAEVVKGKPNHVRTLSLFADGNILDNIEVDLTGTPCETVFANNSVAYASDIQNLFPDAIMMQKMNVAGYFGTMLSGASGSGIGLMAVMYRKPVSNVAMINSTLQIFAARASAELERRHSEDSLKKAKEEIEVWNRELEKRVKEKTEDLKKSQDQLIQSEKLSAMGRLAAGLAHELNSPLAGLLPLLEKYKGQTGEGTREYREMAMMCKAAEHMAKIIRDFGAFSRMREGVFEKISLNDIIDDTLSFSASELRKTGIRITKEYADNLPYIFGDRTELQQVVLNMLTNARDAIQDSGELILKTGVAENKKVVMEFIDNGAGIDKDILNKIFDPFFTTKKAGEGVGLGLSLSYGIIKKHKGEIFVESEPGKGTRFVVAFPIKYLTG